MNILLLYKEWSWSGQINKCTSTGSAKYPDANKYWNKILNAHPGLKQYILVSLSKPLSILYKYYDNKSNTDFKITKWTLHFTPGQWFCLTKCYFLKFSKLLNQYQACGYLFECTYHGDFKIHSWSLQNLEILNLVSS